jgi:hypothetical protein
MWQFTYLAVVSTDKTLIIDPLFCVKYSFWETLWNKYFSVCAPDALYNFCKYDKHNDVTHSVDITSSVVTILAGGYYVTHKRSSIVTMETCVWLSDKQSAYVSYTGYTQNNGAVSLYSPLKPHHYFVYTLYRQIILRGSLLLRTFWSSVPQSENNWF